MPTASLARSKLSRCSRIHGTKLTDRYNLGTDACALVICTQRPVKLLILDLIAAEKTLVVGCTCVEAGGGPDGI